MERTQRGGGGEWNMVGRGSLDPYFQGSFPLDEGVQFRFKLNWEVVV